MSLNKSQTERVQQVWQAYISSGEKILNASKEYTQQELDQRRQDTIPEVLGWINRFLQGNVPLEEFKTGIDGINKRSRLWGFQGINGQMFFNSNLSVSILVNSIIFLLFLNGLTYLLPIIENRPTVCVCPACLLQGTGAGAGVENA